MPALQSGRLGPTSLRIAPVIACTPLTPMTRSARCAAVRLSRMRLSISAKLSTRELSDALCEWRMAQSAEALHQLAGIDVDRAGSGAHSVGGAGIERHVGKIAVELVE